MTLLTRCLVIISLLLIANAMTPVCYAADSNGIDNASVQRGAYIAIASDCTACHTAPGGLPFAGGLPIASPVGTIYSTNITPSSSAGIGAYTEQEFARAIRKGIRKDGANLYPAMPYTSYRLLTDADVHDLYNYFLHGIAPVNTTPQPTALPFPLNIRMSMMAWNLLFLSNGSFQENPAQPADWNRGKYLVDGPAHCGECHTPRGFLMQVESSRYLGGGQVGPWFAPNITPDAESGIGSWTQQEVVQFLRSGSLPDKARAGGGMGEAVEHSFQYLSPADLTAIATYLVTVPPIHDAADVKSRFDFGAPASAVATLRGANAVASETDPSATGAALYSGNCAACHSVFGQGSKDKYFPSLFHNSVTGAGNSSNLIATILYGVQRTTSSGEAYMPGFGGEKTDPYQLNNSQIALLASYVFQQYGRPQSVSESDVAVIRQGGPTSPILLLARFGVVAGVAAAVILLLLILFLVFSRRRHHREA
jgi:fructose 5-dehydrogenase cytochrome subunit